MNEQDMKDLFNEIQLIKSDKELTKKLLDIVTEDMIDVLESAIASKFINPDLLYKIRMILPTCYKIGDKVFLKGGTTGKHDFIGHGLDYVPAIELFDMDYEIENGNGSSFYVSNTEYFSYASLEEHKRVHTFLQNKYK